ncbi:MAG: AEC family transporter [Bacteroidales bacterium]|nr:AEC family transporter [Bacteroidales bacterium]
MQEILLRVLPVVLIFLAGYLLRILRLFHRGDGDVLLRLVFNYSLPALILLSVSRTPLTAELAMLPFVAAGVILFTFAVAWYSGKWLRLERKTMGTFLVGAMILNIGFALPFVISAFGDEGLTRMIIMDFGNGIMVYTFVYLQACRFGQEGTNRSMLVRKVLQSPPFWALLAGISLNAANVRITGWTRSFLEVSGNLTVPLLMLVVGFYFTPGIMKWKAMLSVIFIRMGLGLAAGLALSEVAGLEGLTRMIVIIGSATPVGYNTLTFASMEKLDREFAARIVSVAILIGVVYLPLLIFLFSPG